MTTAALTDMEPVCAGAIGGRTDPQPFTFSPSTACPAHTSQQLPTITCADDQRSLVELLDRLGVLSRLGAVIEDGAEILRRHAGATAALVVLAAPSGLHIIARAGRQFDGCPPALIARARSHGHARESDLGATLLRAGCGHDWLLVTHGVPPADAEPIAALPMGFLDCAFAAYAAAFADSPDVAPPEGRPLSSRHRRLQAMFPHIVSRTPEMLEILALVETFAPTDYPVLIQGESGTGKELVARALHQHSPRAPAPYITENCAAVPEALQESEFFGVTRGAYTGATCDRPGLFRMADGGTLFLDEIGEMPAMLQKKLLRVLQERELRPVGSRTTEKVDVRCVAATNRPLEDLVATGQFRSDLFFRLNTVMLHLPPLRERREDIPLVARHFLAQCRAQWNAETALSPESLAALQDYDWPGNIRELKNEILRANVLSRGGTITPAHLSPHVTGRRRRASARAFLHGELDLPQYERATLAPVIKNTLAAVAGNKTACARLLGIAKTSLYRRMQRYGIPDPETGQVPDLPPPRPRSKARARQ